MPKSPPPPDLMSLFDLLDEQENGPKPCPHAGSVRMQTGGWTHEDDPESPYFTEWVHGDPGCRRSVSPGAHKQPFPTMGWSRELQKDVPL